MAIPQKIELSVIKTFPIFSFRDRRYFEDPDVFRPDRSINNGKVVKLDSFVPFNGSK